MNARDGTGFHERYEDAASPTKETKRGVSRSGCLDQRCVADGPLMSLAAGGAVRPHDARTDAQQRTDLGGHSDVHVLLGFRAHENELFHAAVHTLYVHQE